MDRQAVYIYKLPDEESFTGIVLDVHMYKGNLRYFDTNRGHEIPGKIAEETEKGFAFISEGYMPGEWQFKVLTIEEFKRKYYKLVEGGQTLADKTEIPQMISTNGTGWNSKFEMKEEATA
ncbi:MAG: hypothetical protein ACOX6S_09310 [Clostridia bacterium]